MGKVIELYATAKQEPDEELFPYVKRTEKFIQSAQKLSDFIKELPLNAEQNNILIELIKKHVLYAEDGAYTYGLQQGAQLIIDEMDETGK